MCRGDDKSRRLHCSFNEPDVHWIANIALARVVHSVSFILKRLDELFPRRTVGARSEDCSKTKPRSVCTLRVLAQPAGKSTRRASRAGGYGDTRVPYSKDALDDIRKETRRVDGGQVGKR